MNAEVQAFKAQMQKILDGISANVTNITGDVANLNKQIQDLNAKVQAGQPLGDEDKAAFGEMASLATNIAGNTQALADSVPDTPPVP